MNILIFSWRGPGHSYAGGAEESTHQHAKGWVQAGHKVTLFTASFKGGGKEEDIDGIRVIRRGSQIFGVHLWAILWYVFLPHPKFDIVIDEVHGIPFFSPLFIAAQKLVFIHEVTKEVWRLNPWPKPFNLIPTIIGTFMEPVVFKLLYRKIPFMTVSESTKADLVRWHIPKENITVVHNGFTNRGLIKSIRKENKKTLIYLGTLSRDKGINDALEVFRILYNFEKDWQFWVVGKGEPHYLRYLKQKSDEYGIGKVTQFFGFVSENEKYNLLSRAHILINTSVREGWGLVIIEAASVRTPAVAYNVAGLCDSVKDYKTGLLCQTNPNSCAEKILYLFNNKRLYLSLQENCLRWSKTFSWEKSSKQSLSLLNSFFSNY